jgi:hypothetical protein
MKSTLRPQVREFKDACEKLQRSVQEINGVLTNEECEVVADHIQALEQSVFSRQEDDGQPLALPLGALPPIID